MRESGSTAHTCLIKGYGTWSEIPGITLTPDRMNDRIAAFDICEGAT